MAINPNPDNVPSMMQEDLGTKVLITDVAADRLLAEKMGGMTTQSDYIEWLLERGEWWTL